MDMNIEPFLLQGINLGIGLIKNAVPGGNVAFIAGCDAGELAGKMLQVICPKLKDGNLTQEELDAIIGEFKADVPTGTWTVALAVVKSSLDRIVGGSIKF